MQSCSNILPKDGLVYYHSNFFLREHADELYATLQSTVRWRHEPITLFGKKIMQPRLTAWHGDPGKTYTYSGVKMTPEPWTAPLLLIKSKIEQATQATFNSALLNFYRNGNDSNGWHRDNEKSLGINPTIASVSFGATRTFQLKHATESTLKTKIELTHGSLLLMKGTTQHHWLHCVPKQPKIEAGRINITFRFII
jgi:alkylated DNA repair dioxygenase AlkB